MRVAVTGASGLIGSALRPVLEAAGHEVVPVVRGDDREGIRWDPYGGSIDHDGLAACDAVVHLSGERIRAGRWTAGHKQRVYDSRIRTTRFLAETLAGLEGGPRVLVSGSAVGYYGDRGDEVLSEDSAAGGDDFLSQLCMAWEAATAAAADAGVRVATIRTGLVLSPDGGLLDPFVMPGRVAVAGRLGSGRQWMSWISIADEVEAIRHVLEHDVSGPVNLTAPGAVTNRDFVATLARVLRRPKLPPVPAFAIRLLFGREAADATALVSQKVVPDRLATSGFEFAHPTLEAALRHVFDAA